MENKETNPNEPINMVEYNNNYISTGLTKREYFAAMAMQGIIANKDGLDIKIERIVESAVDTADALIEELNKTK
jgi:nitrogenase subunit NifH